MLSLLPPIAPRFTCPGETHSISRAVHLSRLAAFYPKCRECVHRHESGQLPRTLQEPELDSGTSIVNRPLFTLEGVRGVYLNDLTRTKAAEFATAFASMLWDSLPLTGCAEIRDASVRRTSRRVGPVVVVGFDERTSSPDLVTGVAAALRRMSCQVVDIGQTTVPCFRFGAAHLQAAGGVMVTGHGCEPAWCGLDFVGKWGRPISAARQLADDSVAADDPSSRLTLDAVSERLRFGVARPLRQGGSQRVFQASVPYLAGLWKHFHALRPLRVAIGCGSRLVRGVLLELFGKLPVTLQWVELPQRVRNLRRSDDDDVERVRASVSAHKADLGFVIDDDAVSAAVLDERGESIPSEELLGLITEMLLSEQPVGAVVVETAARGCLQPRLASRGVRCWLGGWTQSDMWQSLRNESAICGGGEQPRLWLRETWPTTDAILTLAKVLQFLSRDDAPLSEVRKNVVSPAIPQAPGSTDIFVEVTQPA